MFLFTPSNIYEKKLHNSWKNTGLPVGFCTKKKLLYSYFYMKSAQVVVFVILQEEMGKLRWLWQQGAEATIDGTSLLTGARPRAGLEQSPTLSGALPGVCARAH